MYPIEPILDHHKIFYRIHKSNIRDGRLIPGAFKEQQGSMSTDWELYSTPEILLARAKTPHDNGIVQLISGEVRSITINQEPEAEKVSVTHGPIFGGPFDNRSHTNVMPVNSNKIRLDMMMIFQWNILPPVPLIRDEEVAHNFID